MAFSVEKTIRGNGVSLLSRILRFGLVVSEYGSVQLAVQLIGAVAGLVIVRSLTKADYALYAVANSGLSMFNVLADTGIGPTMRSIGGEVHSDRARLSQLVATATNLRHWFAVMAFVVSVPVTVWMLRSNGASYSKVIALSIVVVCASWPLLTATVLREAALLLRKYRKVQFADSASSAVRLTLVAAFATRLDCFLGLVCAAVGNWVQWYVYRRRAGDEIDCDAPISAEFRSRALSIVKPMLPNVLFFCFQGQITFVLLTLFGATTGLADVAALGRLSALLAVFSAIFHNILAPQFARCQDPQHLLKLYFGFLSLAAIGLLPALIVAWLWPKPLLWILGGTYSGLERECFLVVAAGCLSQFAGAMLWLNFSRAWIRCYGFANIFSIVVVQTAWIMLFDVSTVHGVILFSIVSAAAPIPVYAADAWLGLRAGSRSIGTHSP